MDDENFELTFWGKLSLRTQRFIGWITYPWWGSVIIFLMRDVGKYRIQRLRAIRRRYQQIIKQSDSPVIICANHLTKIDSALIIWSLASMGSYIRSFRFFSWNLPERARYAGNIFLRIICYLGSCIPVDRGGSREAVKKSMSKLIYLLRRGDAVAIFPEGKRSRDGKIDTTDFSYGVGKLIKSVENCNVLCVYMRGYGQTEHSGIPRIGEKFYFDMKIIKPESVYEGLRATRDLAKQVIQQLKAMEQHYFALCGQ